MADLPPTTAASRSVALRFEPDSDLLAGEFLRLVTSPSATATARTVEGGDLTAATAIARGIGAGYSRYYEGLVDESFFNSRNLSIASGGGAIDGDALATALASGRGDTAAEAVATNIGLANLSYVDRYGGPLLIGSTAKPFTATATAASGSVLGPLPGSSPTTSLDATAVVRGLEGSGELSYRQPLRSAVKPAFTLYGQPNAVVAAQAELLASPKQELQGSATADAKAIDHYQIKAVPEGNGDGAASIIGDASANLLVDGSVQSSVPLVTLNGQAVGIDSSLIHGAPTLNTSISGRGVAVAEVPESAGVELEQLRGVGITNSMLFTNQGNDVVRGIGGIAVPGLALLNASSADAAGIDRSGIYTGIGNDVIFGKVLNEVEADVDADGDGELEAATFLDRSSVSGGPGGFDGIRHSTANTGLGNDLIAGSSSGSHLYTSVGNDSIDLDRAKASSLWGGIGNDLVRIGGTDGSGGPSEGNVLWGGLGNDLLQVGSGDGSVLDGGYGQDVSTGGSGRDRFVLSEGGAAIQAAGSSGFGEQLADLPLWASLSLGQKETLWNTGRLVSSDGSELLGSVDTIRNFQAGSGGDTLEISSSLAGITEELWATKGALYGVSPSGQLTVKEASADGSNKLGVVVGSLTEIQRLGIGSPSIAYATDTRQLMFDADGSWSSGSISLGTVNVTGTLTKENFAFGSTTGNGLGSAPTAQGAV